MQPEGRTDEIIRSSITNEDKQSEWSEAYKVNPHYHQLIVTHATKAVIDEIEDRTTRSRNLIITGLSAVIALLVTVGGFLVNELLTVRVESRVASAIEKEISKAKLGLEAARLSFQASEISGEGGFSDSEAESAIRRLKLWYQQYVSSEKITREEDRQQNLEAIGEPATLLLDIFARAGRLDYCFQLMESTPEVFDQDFDGSYPLFMALADEVFSFVSRPTRSGVGAELQSPYREQFEVQLAKVSRKHYPEAQIFFDALAEEIQSEGKNSVSKTLMAEAGSLKPRDLVGLESIIDSYLTGGFTLQLDSPRGRLICERTRSLLEAVCPIEAIKGSCDAVADLQCIGDN